MRNQTSLTYFENILQLSVLKTSSPVQKGQNGLFWMYANFWFLKNIDIWVHDHSQLQINMYSVWNLTRKNYRCRYNLHSKIASKFHKELQHVELNMKCKDWNSILLL